MLLPYLLTSWALDQYNFRVADGLPNGYETGKHFLKAAIAYEEGLSYWLLSPIVPIIARVLG